LSTDKFHHAAPYRGDAIDHTFKTTAPGVSGKSGCSTAKNMTTASTLRPALAAGLQRRKLHRLGLAVEPMTCPPDAFNSELALFLSPRREHRMRFLIGAE
jgi:aldose 1-epimerase